MPDGIASRRLTLHAPLLASVLCLAAAAPARAQVMMPYSAQDPQIAAMLEEVSADSIMEIIRRLESFGTRHSLSDTTSDTRGVGAAWRWIRARYQSYSPRLQVHYDTHAIPEGEVRRLPDGAFLRNVVAVLPGTDPVLKDKHIIMGGHYDSLNLDPVREGDTYDRRDPNRPAPGANDDASGTAVAMELARVFSRYEFPKTLVFVAFIAEEEGLVGAGRMAARLAERDVDVEAVLNMDMLGNSERGGQGGSKTRTVRVFSEGPEDSDSRQVARYAELMGELYVPDMDVDLIFRRDRFGRGGDHTAFNQEGFAGIRLVEANEDYDRQHSYNDLAEWIDEEYIVRNARVQAAIAANLASAPPAPRPLGLGRGEGYDAALRFSPAEGGQVAGYLVGIRSTTASQWERFVWVGMPEATEMRGRTMMQTLIEGLDIDELVFGIAAVSPRGIPSLFSVYTR